MKIRNKSPKTFFGMQSVRFNRGKTHYATFTGILTLAIFIKSYGIPDYTLIFLIPCALFGMWFIGYLDERYGFYRKENEFSARINPVLNEILRNTRELKKNRQMNGDDKDGQAVRP